MRYSLNNISADCTNHVVDEQRRECDDTRIGDYAEVGEDVEQMQPRLDVFRAHRDASGIQAISIIHNNSPQFD